jgi:ribosomal protein L16/L10AE
MIHLNKLKLIFNINDNRTLKKQHLIKIKSGRQILNGTSFLNHGHYIIGQKAVKLNVKQLEISYKSLKRELKWCKKMINIAVFYFPLAILTKKPKDVRMGRGKGLPSVKFVNYREGSVFFSLQFFSHWYAVRVCSKLCTKLPLNGKVIYKTTWW